MSLLENLNDTHACVRYVSPQVSPPQPVTIPNEFPPRGGGTSSPIGELPDNVFLNIFRYYLDVSPRQWPRLVHICRRWRRIVFASRQILRLRIFCTHGTPVLETLRSWPAMPIVVQYGGSQELAPPAPEDEDNIIVALKESDRVSSINLTATKSLLKKLSAIERPFSELDDLVLLFQDSVPLTLPSAFLWCPRLRCLHLTGTAFPAILRLLYSSTNLVDLQLYDVLNPLYFSPEVLIDALSGMAQLRSLSLHPTFTTNYDILPPESWERRVLPVLTRLNFRGIYQYLERFVAGIDAPRLGDIEITFVNENIISFPTLLEFIKMHKSHHRAHIISSERAISISLIQPGASACLKLQFFCEPLDKQLLFVTRVCVHLSNSLFNAEDLRISATRPLGQGDSNYRGWRDLLNSFTSVQRFRVAGNLSTNIVRALRGDNVIPSLHTLYIAQPGPRHAPLREAVVTFMTSRRLSGHPIAVEYERLSHINELRGTGPSSQQVTIGMLSDDIFLNIFRGYLDGAPRTWPTLTYVCQRWRQIVHTSPLGLNLRLYCTYGTPVLKTLDCWPALPIIVQYGGLPDLDPPSPVDDDNIVAALKRSGHVNSISLTVTSSLLGRLSAISEPFSELEELVLLSRDNMRLTLPSNFRWGPRLCALQSTRIAFPLLPQLLSHSHDLVDIQLHEIPSAGYFSPEAFANALSGIICKHN
ncbi:hypothetical protein EDB83DRAFT_426935 [Lactarius deliciosus]|nr:hypothetical protein EDB83DRAFT_426935 [Lactarius deliciosus]